jgi:hypothetical protein
MKTRVWLVLATLSVAAFVGTTTQSARADDKASASGKWTWSRKLPGGQDQQITAKLKQDGENLSGNVASPIGAVKIQEGKFKDGQVSFQIAIPRGDGTNLTVKFSGKLDGDTITGKVEAPGGPPADWTAKRAKEVKKEEKKEEKKQE